MSASVAFGKPDRAKNDTACAPASRSAEGAPAFANANQAANGDAEGAEGESAMATENGREN